MFSFIKNLFFKKDSNPRIKTVATSSAGTNTYEYSNPKDFELVIGDSDYIDTVTNHVEKYVGKVDNVFHELVSDKVHVDLILVKPTEERNYWTVVTCGMGQRRMKVPEEVKDYSRMELCMTFPPDWPMSQESFEDENNYWPLRIMKVLARMPYDYDTYFLPGHTVEFGNENKPIANTNFTSGIMLYSSIFDRGFDVMDYEGEKVQFLSLVPLYKEEKDLKLTVGFEDFVKVYTTMSENDLQFEPLNLNRKSMLEFL